MVYASHVRERGTQRQVFQAVHLVSRTEIEGNAGAGHTRFEFLEVFDAPLFIHLKVRLLECESPFGLSHHFPLVVVEREVQLFHFQIGIGQSQ